MTEGVKLERLSVRAVDKWLRHAKVIVQKQVVLYSLIVVMMSFGPRCQVVLDQLRR